MGRMLTPRHHHPLGLQDLFLLSFSCLLLFIPRTMSCRDSVLLNAPLRPLPCLAHRTGQDRTAHYCTYDHVSEDARLSFFCFVLFCSGFLQALLLPLSSDQLTQKYLFVASAGSYYLLCWVERNLRYDTVRSITIRVGERVQYHEKFYQW
jgi:hypothetical protein